MHDEPEVPAGPAPADAVEPVPGPAPPRRRPQIVLTVLAILLAVSIGPLALMGWRLAKSMSEDLADNQKEVQLDKGQTIAAMLSRYVAEHFARLEVVGEAVEFLDATGATSDEAALRSLLDGVVRSAGSGELGSDGILELRYVPADGSLPVVRTHAASFDPDLAREELESAVEDAIRKGRRGSRHLSNPFVPQALFHPLAVFAVPLDSPRSPQHAVLVAVVSMARIQEEIQGRGETAGSGYTAFVLDDSDPPKPFAHTQFTKVIDRVDMSSSVLVQDFLTHGQRDAAVREFQERQPDGSERAMIGAYVPVQVGNEHRWGVFVEVDRETGFFQVRQMRMAFVKWGLVAFTLAIVIGIVFSWRVTEPIHQLIESTRRVASGEYGRHVKVSVNNELGMLADNFNTMSEEIRRTFSDLTQAKELNDQLFLASIRSLAAAIDARDPYTRGHSERVTRYSRIIARQLKLGPAQVRNVEVGALLHDIGKIGIEDRILRKPAALTPEEFELMKTHPEKGGDIMAPIPDLREATEIIIHHHERWEGNGYPSGLKGEEIPLGARIVNVADTFDAMTTNRPYQRAMTFAVAARKISEFSGKACDPKVVEAFQAAMEAGLFGNQVESQPQTA